MDRHWYDSGKQKYINYEMPFASVKVKVVRIQINRICKRPYFLRDSKYIHYKWNFNLGFQTLTFPKKTKYF